MKSKNQTIFSMIFLIGVLLSVFLLLTILMSGTVSAYSYSNPNYGAFDSFVSSSVDYECEEGQDFVVQISPFGCTPSVVRSDLLEEQNVPVFCPLMATQINPLIDVEVIEGMTLTGQYPSEVSGVGFYPAQAALGVSGNLNNPTYENIGYAVIVLREQDNESSMPDFVSGNLTARLQYDVENAYGIGKTTFYLPQMSDSEFYDARNSYSFWDGRGYLKADEVGADDAVISVYTDSGRLSSVRLEDGETSNDIALPGFDCLVNMQLKLDDLEAPDTRARLEINGEVVEVVDDGYFLDNRCQVKDIEKNGLSQSVEIYCKEDESSGFLSGSAFTLSISPRVNLTICDEDGKTNCVNKEFETGDILYQDEVSKRNVFLGYVNKRGTGDLIVVPIITTDTSKDEFLRSFDSKAIEKYIDIEDQIIKGMSILTLGKLFGAIQGSLFNALVRGSDFGPIISEGESEEVIFNFLEVLEPHKDMLETPFIGNILTFYGGNEITFDEYTKKSITFNGLAGAIDGEIPGGDVTKSNYLNALEDYDTLINNYASEQFDDEVSYSEKSLYEKIELLNYMRQKKTVVDLCKQFEEDYSDPENISNACKDEIELANAGNSSISVVINGNSKTISFLEVSEPDFEDLGAIVKVTGTNNFDGEKKLQLNERIPLSGDEWFELSEVEEEYIKIKVNVEKGAVSGAISGRDTGTYKINLNDYQIIGANNYEIKLTDINLKKVAKVSVLPNVDNSGTMTNFSFSIGIEKRAIQLSPEKTRERIDNLNESIEKWEDVSDTLGVVVKGLKGACLATGVGLTVKNFLQNGFGGGADAVARQQVMTEDGGWNDICADAVAGKGILKDKGFTSFEDCIYDDGTIKQIDEAVKARNNLIEQLNSEMQTAQKGCDPTDFLLETTYDTDCVKNNFWTSSTKSDIETALSKLADTNGNIKINNQEVPVSFISELNANQLTIEEMRELVIYSQSDSSSASLNLKELFGNLHADNQKAVAINSLANDFAGKGYANADISWSSDKEATTGIWNGWKISGSKIKGVDGIDAAKTYNVKIQGYGSKTYLFLLDGKEGSTYGGTAYEFNGFDTSGNLNAGAKDDSVSRKFVYTLVDAESYNNKFIATAGDTRPKVHYYETEPYAGYPSVVPFDKDDGWYAALKQTLAVGGNVQTADDSGRVTSFYLCNVGEDGREDGVGNDDDICELINTYTGQPYNQFPGIEDESEASELVDCAIDAISDAQSQYKSGVTQVTIKTSCGGSWTLPVGSPAVDVPEMQCTNFMSPSDCLLLFNVCDPVICPSSRCDFGGTYAVTDVIQSGIIGSIVLCFPNYREGIKIPVCLSGISAGIESYISILKSHRDCLQESLETGEMVGICDEIYSIYACEFFWKQALPITNLAIPKLLAVLSGQTTSGGGEYLGVASAWQAASDSVSYFTQYYAANSFEAFQSRTTEEVGTELCSNFASGVYANGEDLLSALTDPDSPPQFYGTFEEIEFTTATVPPVSQYKVFYHIYAGDDSSAYYKVYLSGSQTSSYYQDINSNYIVDSGYITKGDYASETVDFTATSGYQELCIQVNEQTECGFGESTTSYAVNYIADKYAEDVATQTDITTTSGCVSGDFSWYSLLSTNLQSSLESAIDPEIYNDGIIRVCATDSPGSGTDANDGTDSARWVEVGYCDDTDIKCWIDMESVEEVIEDLNIQNDTLSELYESYEDILVNEGVYLKQDVAATKINDLRGYLDKGKFADVVGNVSEILQKVYMSNQKAQLLFLRAQAYRGLAKIAKKVKDDEEKDEPQEEEEETGITEEEETGFSYSENSVEEVCSKACEDEGFGEVLIAGAIESECDEEYIDVENVEIGGDSFDSVGCCCYGDEEEVETEDYCSSYTCVEATSVSEGVNVLGGDCQKDLGEKIIEIAKVIKEKNNIDDSQVEADTGAKSFECLILQQAMQESCLAHCVYKEDETDAFYCDGNLESVVGGDGGDSVGVLQINLEAHPSMEGKAEDVTDNIEYGINYLILRYNYCKNNQNTEDWRAALNSYNGLGCQESADYSEKVVGRQETIEEMFSDVCGRE